MKSNTQSESLKKTIRVNLIAPPNRGKTCLSYLLGANLKLQHSINTEVVSETAKEKAYMGIDLSKEEVNLQILEINEQARRENIYKGKVDCLVTSSPLKMIALYSRDTVKLLEESKTNNEGWHDLYFFLTEDTTMSFEQAGRELWTMEGTRKFEPVIKDFFHSQNIELIPVTGTPNERCDFIMNCVKTILKK